jgi:triosephosphate isomerase
VQSERPLVAGNWKMHKLIRESVAYVEELLTLDIDYDACDAVLFPPFTSLHAVGRALGHSPVGLGAQTMGDADSGAFTGEISAPMVLDAGAAWVLLGHSERRTYNGETDTVINIKVQAALRHRITPIIAVGEPLAVHVAGGERAYVANQVEAAFDGIARDDVAKCVIAYEPLWAIGSGKSDDPASANAVMHRIRHTVPGLEHVRMLYGGSVKPDNIASYIEQPDIDGALVGGASLDPRSLAALIANACMGVRR